MLYVKILLWVAVLGNLFTSGVCLGKGETREGFEHLIAYGLNVIALYYVMTQGC